MRSYHRAAIALALTTLTLALITGGGCGRSGDVTGEAPGGAQASGGAGGGGPAPDITDFEPCAEVSSEASLVPVAMFVAVDISGSMNDAGKFDDTKAAFTAFFQDPQAAGLQVALRFWPFDGCDDVTCDVDACATPEVPLGLLSDAAHRQALIDAFNAKTPQGPTPMSAALAGAAQWAHDHIAATPGPEKVVIILVTDGEPHGCVEDITVISQTAADAWSTDGVRTYAVGLQGSAEADMNAIALAGETNAGIFIGSGNAQQDLLDALLAIAGDAVDCSFVVPDPSDPQSQLDPRQVRVEYTPGSSATELLDHVADASACGASGGWYYDDPNDPTTITLCPSSCTAAQADSQAKLAVAMGCECDVDADCTGELICVDHHCIPPCHDDSDCPTGQICHDSRCIPQPGDPCVVDTDCPPPLGCFGDQCGLEGEIVVGPYEAVQGGAFNCAMGSSPARGRLGALWLALLGLGLAVARRRRLA